MHEANYNNYRYNAIESQKKAQQAQIAQQIKSNGNQKQNRRNR